MKAFLTILALFIFSNMYSLNVTINTQTFNCGSFSVSGNTGCNHNGALNIQVDGTTDGIHISGISTITNGNFTFNMTISPGAPAAAILIFTILTSDDPTGCALPNATQNLTIDVNCNCSLQVTANIHDESCFGCDDGSIEVDVSGNVMPTTFIWSNGATDTSVYSLSPGVYALSLTDGIGCTYADSFIINPYICSPFTLFDTVTHATCHHDCNGSIQLLSLSNSSTSYTAVWEDGPVGTYLEDLCAAQYIVTITDSDQCAEVFTIEVNQPPLNTIAVDSVSHATNGTNGAVFFTLNPGDHEITNCELRCKCCEGFCGICGDFTNNMMSSVNLAPDIYVLILRFSNGCIIQSDSFEIQNISSAIIEEVTEVLTVYPNPTHDFLHIKSNMKVTENASNPVKITDLTGRILITSNSDNGIDVRSLQNGIYIVQIENKFKITKTLFTKL